MALDDDIAILAAAPLFGLMDRDALRLISFAAERRRLAPGAVLFSRGAPADGGFVVTSGIVVLEPRSPHGAPVEAGPSALIGQTALFLPLERPSTARAGDEPVEVMVVTQALMRRVLEVFPDAAAVIHDALADELAALTRTFAGSRAADPA
ncbi:MULTISPECIES: Crp/Fnr family transcriptional regulator [Methylobacterium]|uniref:Cyclic nucleotide-binding protein n=2 Tax=Methylobacterium TaxID=407 RepID=A0A0C6FFA5_9HYPH|nr:MULTISPECIES: Crp/Fnr family transcriptional regulator [Methylobacterium]MBK3400275.1 Crp/Fnr family transcriptional regulator [Methylobacterium ajmalii]MBK3411869.1 Crp/Fnr family transcriptional regulator [Methylobacterium ajmalii]MBK3422260.1 Crp/Fnr family transcriptional regulator [Methylobacterium ajmalii]MBZ6411664.1 Crp/Fnr family transcriptional regulator [Methylobacterium sp.]SFE42584.1 Cyclic nucleotide-binding domain-containing protein [Methylobacterium sp. yr596]